MVSGIKVSKFSDTKTLNRGSPNMPIRSDVRLTQTHVNSLKAGAKDYFVFDAEIAGFGVRVRHVPRQRHWNQLG
jgi:hypothetical protein